MSTLESYKVVNPATLKVSDRGPVRLFGRLKSYDYAKDLVVVEFQGHLAKVSIRLLDPLDFSSISQVEVFGHLLDSLDDYSDNCPVLEAKILNPINGVDLGLYSRILRLLEKHF